MGRVQEHDLPMPEIEPIPYGDGTGDGKWLHKLDWFDNYPQGFIPLQRLYLHNAAGIIKCHVIHFSGLADQEDLQKLVAMGFPKNVRPMFDGNGTHNPPWDKKTLDEAYQKWKG